jgi:hypothetical protein
MDGAAIERSPEPEPSPAMDRTTPIVTLTVLGALIVILGLFAAGDIVVVAMGLAAVFAAAVLATLADRAVADLG